MLGWLVVAGLVGAALASGSRDDNTDYGLRISKKHKTCACCLNSDVSVYRLKGNSSFVKLLFVCNDCGRRWTKTYRFN